MRKIIALLLTVTLLATGCARVPAETTEPTVPTTQAPTVIPTTQSTDPVPTTEPVDARIQFLRDNLPTIDGSTSLLPLEAGIRAALFGKTIEEATADVSHTSTWGSFHNLVDGQVDMIFSCPLSDEQYEIANQAGVTLETVAVAMEGFVFVVNAENPVDTLTQQQLKDIYSGKITNWKEVGGLDEEIIAYQRNRDSGSQNYMIYFMGDTPLMDAPTEKRPASMSGLMDVIAVNDNSRAAIGYSVYAYAADMYGNGNEIKFIQVDGVAPSKATFADGTYPLMGYNYAVFNASEPEDSNVRRLVEWIVSDEGQYAIAEAGYVTVRDIGYDYTEATLEKYEGVGTGPVAEEVPSHEYRIIQTLSREERWGLYTYHTNTLSLDENNHLTQLADKALEAEINAWIDEQITLHRPQMNAMLEFVKSLNNGYAYGLYDTDFGGDSPLHCEISVKNGYLSAAVSLRYWKNGNNEHYKYYLTETAVWDLVAGERVPVEGLFCQGMDIDQILNEYLRQYTQTTRSEFGHNPEMIQDFVALPESGWHLTTEGIYIDHSSQYFVNGEFIPFDWFPDGALTAEIPRDFTDAILSDENLTVVKAIRTSDRDLKFVHYGSDERNYVALLKEDVYPNAQKVNKDLLEYVNTYYDTAVIIRYYEGLGYTQDHLDLMWMDWSATILGNRYLLADGFRPNIYLSDSIVYFPHIAHLLYDLETGQRIDWTQILRDGWLEASSMTSSSTDEPVETPFCKDLKTDWFRYYSDTNQFTVHLLDGDQGYYLRIPGEYIKF